MSVIKFSFVAIGETRQEVLDELDAKVALVLQHTAGEPWVSMQDEVKKLPIDPQSMLEGKPGTFVYRAEQEIVFAGPTPLGPQKPSWGDGFRPQH